MVKKAPAKAASASKKAAAEPVLLAGGNPQIAKGDGDAPVQAYIAAMPGWKRDVGRRLDQLIERTVPDVRKAVKWNSPFYGVEGQGWFLNVHCFTKYVKVAFFRGSSLRPVPPGASKHAEVRYLDVHEDDALDDAQLAAWVKQASELPGEHLQVGRLDGMVALITGGAKGQGAAEAALFRAEGAVVWIVDVDDARGQATATEVGAAYRHLDVRDEAAWSEVVAAIVASHGRLDVLVNNAGTFTYARLVETSVEDFTRQFDVNQLGVFLGMRAVAPTMIAARRGSIVNISSSAGLVGMANAVGYTATKWAVRGMTKAVALELGRFGVRVNSVHPGVIDTDLLYENPVMRREDLGPVLRSVPLGRMAQPAEVATLALFLASDESSYCTGGEFAVDGGVTAS